jgi:hypothetical protein
MTSKKDLRFLCDEINTLAGTTPETAYYIEYAYGIPRLVKLTGNGGSDNMSPRLSPIALREWMLAWIEGHKAGAQHGRQKLLCEMRDFTEKLPDNATFTEGYNKGYTQCLEDNNIVNIL